MDERSVDGAVAGHEISVARKARSEDDLAPAIFNVAHRQAVIAEDDMLRLPLGQIFTQARGVGIDKTRLIVKWRE